MSITERQVYLAELCKSYPGSRGASHLCPSTVTRWIVNGVRGVDGQRRKLRAVRLGSRWAVRPSDLEAFVASLGAMPDDEAQPITASQRKAMDEADSAKLKQLLAK